MGVARRIEKELIPKKRLEETIAKEEKLISLIDNYNAYTTLINLEDSGYISPLIGDDIFEYK